MRLSLTLFAASALLICANAQVPSYVPTDGLVGWWPFNGNAVDESGNGNDGAVNGATLTPDRVGNANTAYAFDGIDDKIEVPNSNSLNPANVTFNFWMYANSDDVCVLSKQNHNDATSHSYVITHQEIWTSNRGLRTSWGLDCNLTASIADWGPLGAVPNNDWVMLTISIDSSGLCKQYVNAALNHTFDEQDFSTCNDSNSPLFIGHHWATDPKWMNGILDDIGMWSRALDSTEIMDLYTANIVVAPCVSGTSVSYTGLGSSYDPSDAAVTLVGTPANGVFIGPGISGNTFDPASAGVGTHGHHLCICRRQRLCEYLQPVHVR
jgi:hypothetical protein